jgi:cyclophilin family peptidyl-prolyl cis-trans isomerase/predicted enzyme related to lactoylglutathione lyase
MVRCRRLVSLFLPLYLLLACGGPAGNGNTPEEGSVSTPAASLSPILATNAFYYYADLDAAWEFYARVLGFQTVADYGFAKILQVSPTSFLTLVDEARGMHDSSEPKSVTLAIVTEEVEEWWDYLDGLGVEMRGTLGTVEPGQPHDGFVAIDPEGYLLEFERFNPHPENTELIPVLQEIQPLYPTAGQEPAPGIETLRPENLGVQATVVWLYYRDLGQIQSFYQAVFDRDIIVDQGWAKVFQTSPSGFIGFVDGERGLHSATDEKAVTVSFFTESLEAWFAHVRDVPGFEARSPEIGAEGDFVHTFVGYDPEGYYLEWDAFLDVPVNDELLRRLNNGVNEGIEGRSSTVQIEIETELGTIVMDVFPERAPGSVANFLRYVDEGFYDGGTFHRTVRADNQPNDSVRIAVIQGDVATEHREDRYPPIQLERTTQTGLEHVSGAVSMARGGPDTATSSFFICVGDQPELNFGGNRNPDGQGFAAFGVVVEGMEVVEAINRAPAEAQSLTPPIGILRVARR